MRWTGRAVLVRPAAMRELLCDLTGRGKMAMEQRRTDDPPRPRPVHRGGQWPDRRGRSDPPRRRDLRSHARASADLFRDQQRSEPEQGETGELLGALAECLVQTCAESEAELRECERLRPD